VGGGHFRSVVDFGGRSNTESITATLARLNCCLDLIVVHDNLLTGAEASSHPLSQLGRSGSDISDVDVAVGSGGYHFHRSFLGLQPVAAPAWVVGVVIRLRLSRSTPRVRAACRTEILVMIGSLSTGPG
jgi:hypothetical protein